MNVVDIFFFIWLTFVILVILCAYKLIRKMEDKISYLESENDRLKKEVNRGSPKIRHKRIMPHHFADPIVDVAFIEGEGYAFADHELTRPRERYLKLVDELPKHLRK